jgi:hypothetical protein
LTTSELTPEKQLFLAKARGLKKENRIQPASQPWRTSGICGTIWYVKTEPLMGQIDSPCGPGTQVR